MFCKVVIFAFIALAVAAPQHQQAAQFPAGVDPALCPAFPNCDNALLHNPQGHQQSGQWNAQPHHESGQWNPQSNHDESGQWNPQSHHDESGQWNAQPHHESGQWNAQPAQYNSYPTLNGPANNHLPGAGGDKYPAGVNPQSCPNYPYCDNAGGHQAPQIAPLPGWTERQYPAGVSPNACPNFPFCS